MFLFGSTEENRTLDLTIMSRALLPAELLCRNGGEEGSRTLYLLRARQAL